MNFYLNINVCLHISLLLNDFCINKKIAKKYFILHLITDKITELKHTMVEMQCFSLFLSSFVKPREPAPVVMVE